MPFHLKLRKTIDIFDRRHSFTAFHLLKHKYPSVYASRSASRHFSRLSFVSCFFLMMDDATLSKLILTGGEKSSGDSDVMNRLVSNVCLCSCYLKCKSKFQQHNKDSICLRNLIPNCFHDDEFWKDHRSPSVYFVSYFFLLIVCLFYQHYKLLLHFLF